MPELMKAEPQVIARSMPRSAMRIINFWHWLGVPDMVIEVTEVASAVISNRSVVSTLMTGVAEDTIDVTRGCAPGFIPCGPGGPIASDIPTVDDGGVIAMTVDGGAISITAPFGIWMG